MKKITCLLIFSSVFLSGCVPASLGRNVPLQQMWYPTKSVPNTAIVVIEESQSATFDCLTRWVGTRNPFSLRRDNRLLTGLGGHLFWNR